MACTVPTVSSRESGKSKKRWPRAKALSAILLLSVISWSAVAFAGMGLVHLAGRVSESTDPRTTMVAGRKIAATAETSAQALNNIATAAGPRAVADVGSAVLNEREHPLAALQDHAVIIELAQDPQASRVLRAKYTSAAAMVERLGGVVIAMLSDESLSQAERETRFRSLLVESFDFPTIGRIVLGRYWRRATPEQRSEYQRLFQDYIVVTYANRFKSYSGETLVVKGSRPGRNNVTVVRSEFRLTRGEPVAVDWLVVERDGQYKIIDVVVAGVSMAITHRSDFAAVINRSGGVDGLLVELRIKVGAGETHS